MQPIRLYTTNYCPFCIQAKQLLQRLKLDFEEISLEDQDDLRSQLSHENGGWRTVPMIFVGKKFVGGFNDLAALHRDGKLLPMVQS